MLRHALVALSLLAMSCGGRADGDCKNPIAPDSPLALVRPCNESHVGWRATVEGKTTIPNADVHVVIHPLEVSGYWVQPRITVRSDGWWEVLAYFGNDGPTHQGKRFEVMAVANPTRPLKEGDVLPDWPDAAARSAVVMVTRR